MIKIDTAAILEPYKGCAFLIIYSWGPLGAIINLCVKPRSHETWQDYTTACSASFDIGMELSRYHILLA